MPRWIPWVLLGSITMLAALLRCVRVSEAPGGFLVFNELFYLDLATNELQRGPFAWFFSPLDVNNPPLLNGLVSTVLRLGGPVVESARSVSIAAGLATIVITFLLGRLLFDWRTGTMAAAALATMPGVALVNRNIQVDSLFVALLLAAVYSYVRCTKNGKLADALMGGVFLGLAMLAKQPAVLAIPALAIWRTWAQGSLAWMRERRSQAFAAVALAVGGFWYVFHLVVGKDRLAKAAMGVANRPDMLTIDAEFFSRLLARELAWMVFPLAAIVALIGIFIMARRRQTGDRLVLVFLAIYTTYYVFFHLHPYYLLPLSPFIALAIGRACFGAFDSLSTASYLRTAGACLLIASMTLGSIIAMGGHKWGRWSPMDLSLRPDPGFESIHLYYESKLDGFFTPLSGAIDQEYSPTAATPEQYAAAPMEAGVEHLYLSRTLYAPTGEKLPTRQDLQETWVRPVLFGYALGQRWELPQRTQLFWNAPWTAERVGPVWQMGFVSTTRSAAYSVYRIDLEPEL